MSDAKPVLTLLVLCGCGLFWLGLDWVGTSTPARGHRLLAIALAEDARTLPPVALRAQAEWLVAHRLARLQGLSLVCGLGALLGLAEGIRWRRRDPQGGMGLRNWTIGLLGAALVPGIAGALLLFPLPWPVVLVGSVGTVWSALILFLLSSGRPYVA